METSGLRTKYEETGSVAVPKVTPGSAIALRMVFTQTRAPAVYEHWFTRPIPVQSGRLVVHIDDGMRFTYDHAEYGTRVRPQESAPTQYGGRTVSWKVNGLEPDDSLPYAHRVSESEPRVVLRIDPLYGTHGNVITQWSEMAGVINQLVIDPAMENAEDEIAAKASEITKGKRNNRTRAVAIVEWVQQNITCAPEQSNGKVADLLHGAKSDMVMVSVLCKALLKSAGISSHLILTRAHSRGGFDPAMQTYAACREGILVVKFDTTEYAIAPAFAGYPIGTYPADYFDLSGLNMDSYKTVRLPVPRWDRYDERTRITLSLYSDTAVQAFKQTFLEMSMPSVRRRFAHLSENQQREAVERMLRRHGDRNALLSFSVKGLGDYDPDVTVMGRFRTTNPPAVTAGAQRVDLSSFMTNVYADIDSTRPDDIVVPVPVTHIDTLEVMKENGLQVTLDASAWKIDDSLFSARISVEQTPSSLLFIREVETRRCIVPRSKIAAIVNDIGALERASRVAAVVKTAGRRK
jgi:Transglutaminase-like superfamily